MPSRIVSNWLFSSEAAELNPNIELIDEYIGSRTKIRVRCKICGQEYLELPRNILSNKPHTNCKDKKGQCEIGYHKKKEQKEIIKRLKYLDNNHGTLMFNSVYNPVTTMIECKCNKCGSIFSESLEKIYHADCLCPYCSLEKKISNSLDISSAVGQNWEQVRYLLVCSKGISLISKKGSRLHCMCDTCNTIFYIDDFMKRKRIVCPACSKKQKAEAKVNRVLKETSSEYTSIKRKCDYISQCIRRRKELCGDCKIKKEPYYRKDEFKEMAESSNPSVLLIDDYVNVETNLRFQCRKCGEIFVGKPRALLAGKCFCKKCNMSKGEKIISSFLETHNIKYESEKSFENCRDIRLLRFDFFLPDYNICVEYDGKQHYEPVEWFNQTEETYKSLKRRDKIKNDYCRENGYSLIRISYKSKNITEDIEKKLNKINPAILSGR